MSVGFNTDEIFDMAEQIEIRGGKFYRKAAKLHVAYRDLLMQIAAQEDAHRARFSEMRKQMMPQERRTGGSPDLTGETAQYVSALVDHFGFHVTRDPSEIITGKEKVDFVFDKAIEMEQQSILFYVGLADMVETDTAKKRLQQIIREEMQHVTWLNNKRATFGK